MKNEFVFSVKTVPHGSQYHWSLVVPWSPGLCEVKLVTELVLVHTERAQRSWNYFFFSFICTESCGLVLGSDVRSVCCVR